MKKELFDWFVAILVAVVFVIVVKTFLITPYSVSGLSMYPTFDDKDKVIVSKISKTFDRLDNGDVVVFHQNKKNDYIKRIIGKPGDSVSYHNDTLFVNEKKVEESYLKLNKSNKSSVLLTENFNVSDLKGSDNKKKIPKNKYLVLGDNRENSIDSRSSIVGLVDKDQIVGKVIMRFWPFKDIRFNFNY
ncbi:signal peptidase I [Staphylococcus aureus]|nr:signal peptidase I [Staphylococcus aureus]